ncbi:MAG: hypothetical protein WC145_10175 [Aliarcobacter sp.]|jgi:hypothetical protein
MFLAFYPLLEDSFMINVILISFTASTPVAADMYCDMNTKTGGGIR